MDIFTLPSTLAGWVSLIAIDIGGVFALASIFDKTRNDRRKEIDQETTKLIDILKEKVEVLETKTTDSEKKANDLGIELIKIQERSKIMADLLQGRDKSTVEFQNAGLEAMKVVAETHILARQNGEKLNSLIVNIDKLVLQMKESNKKS